MCKRQRIACGCNGTRRELPQVRREAAQQTRPEIEESCERFTSDCVTETRRQPAQPCDEMLTTLRPNIGIKADQGSTNPVYVNVRTVNLDALDGVLVDQIALGTTWASVVPEPGSLGLLALAGCTCLLRRRRSA